MVMNQLVMELDRLVNTATSFPTVLAEARLDAEMAFNEVTPPDFVNAIAGQPQDLIF